MINESVCFAIESSLVDLFQGQVPNFSKTSQAWMERDVNGGLQVYPVGAYYPAIDPDDGSWLVEPDAVNLINWNLDFTKNIWLKGSNVIIFPDEVVAADNSYLADRILFAQGSGNTQSLKRSFSLMPATDYYFSAIIALAEGSQANTSDVIQIKGAVTGTAVAQLTRLNGYGNRYRLIEIPFTTSGVQPQLPAYGHEPQGIVSSFTNNSVVITYKETIRENQFKGAQIIFSNIPDRVYLVSGNTAAAAESPCMITLETSSLVAHGINANSLAILKNPPPAEVELEIYVESTLAIHLSGMQLEQRSFRTSMIFQNSDLDIRSSTRLTYRKSPIANLKTCGLFIEIKEWRGDGSLFDAGNLKASIINSKLVVTAGIAVITSPQDLAKSAKIFIQISQENNNICIYIDNILVARSNLANFVGQNTELNFASNGFRLYKRFLVTDKLLLDGRPEVGQTGELDVQELFTSPVIIDAVAISSNAPLINLPKVALPPKPSPIAVSRIVALNNQSNTIRVANVTGFLPNTNVTVIRDNNPIIQPRINTINNDQIVLDVTAGMRIGDYLVFGYSNEPSTVSVRFPFTPIDQQRILEVDTNTKRIRVGSTLSFSKTRCFVTTPLYQDIAEVIIENIDNNNGYLFVDDVTGISAGDIIAQAESEMLVDPPNYFYGLLRPVAGVKVAQPHQNGIILENYNSYPVECEPYIRIYL